MKKVRDTGVNARKLIAAAVVLILGLTVYAALFLMCRAKGPGCYIQGCQKRGVHAVRVCEDHRR